MTKKKTRPQQAPRQSRPLKGGGPSEGHVPDALLSPMEEKEIREERLTLGTDLLHSRTENATGPNRKKVVGG